MRSKSKDQRKRDLFVCGDIPGNAFSSTVALSVLASMDYAIDLVDEAEEAETTSNMTADDDHISAALAAVQRAKR